MLRAARKRMRRGGEAELQQQAERIAWRQILRWLQAQLALIETGMVDAPEVFFPYALTQTKDGAPITLYQLAASEFRMLEGG
jgi:hypothetical protein